MIQKTFENKSGNIKVVQTSGINARSAVVEMMHLWDKNKSGCVICFWIVDKETGVPEIQVVGDRLTSQEWDFDIMEALRYGQELAKVLTKSDNE